MARLTWLALSLTGITTLILSACSGGSTTAPTSAPTSTSRPTSGSSPVASATASISQPPPASATPRPTTPPPTQPPPPTTIPTRTTPPTATSIPLPPTGIQAGRYEWLDTSDPLPPNASKITLTELGGWRSRVTGAAGAVAPNGPVVVSCINFPNTQAALSTAEGSFSLELYAPLGCTLEVKHDPAGRWLVNPNLLRDPRPVQLNAAPGTFIATSATPPGSTNFTVIGRVHNGLGIHEPETVVPAKVSGSVNSLQLTPGGPLQVGGSVKVLLPPGSAVPAVPGRLSISLQSTAGADGNFTGAGQRFGSVLKTPVGAPIERWVSGRGAFESGLPLTFTALGNGEYSAPFQLSTTLPTSLAAGHYRLAFQTSWDGARWATPPVSLGAFIAMYAYNEDFGPTVKVGNPAPPRLPIMLLTDAVYNGVRGVEDPAQAWRSAQRITEPASYTVLPRLSATGTPRQYRLEPAVPELSYGDRGLPRPAVVALRLPGGTITTTVSGPGGTRTLGPAPLQQTRGSLPGTVGGQLLNNGGGHLGDPLELTTGLPEFRFTFPSDGTYTVHVQGSVPDQSGFVWTMDGTFKVVIAEQLDLDPGVLPGLPLKVGEQLPIALQVDPGLPAQVETIVRFAPDSDAARLVTRTFSGSANRFGYFYNGEAFSFAQPGEYAIEYRASYQRGDSLWAGVLAWTGVVAEANSPIVMHGRRGIDTEDQPTLDRYTRAQTGLATNTGTHMNLPYWSGDVLLQTDDDAAQVRGSFADPTGAVRQFYLSHADPDLGPEGAVPGARRFELNEAPFVSKTSSGLDPTIDPSKIDLAAYYYSSVARPGERVRTGATEDNTSTFYWRFVDQYAAQPGMGVEGDRPGDVKFQYLGGVIRTPQRNYYGRYASLWVELPDGAQPGSRVVAPLTENLLRAGGKDVRLFTILTLTKPGTVLEAGNTFGLAGQVGPTIAARVRVEVTGPGNLRKSWDVQTNEIGQYYVADAATKLDAPGIYTVTVAVTSGSVQGQLFDWTSFPLPVVPAGAALVPTNLPSSGIVTELTVNLGVQATNPVRALLTVPGWIVQDQERRPSGGATVLTLDAAALQQQYPFIDTLQPASPEPGLADSFVWVIMTGDGANLQVRRVVLQGPQLWNLG